MYILTIYCFGNDNYILYFDNNNMIIYKSTEKVYDININKLSDYFLDISIGLNNIFKIEREEDTEDYEELFNEEIDIDISFILSYKVLYGISKYKIEIVSGDYIIFSIAFKPKKLELRKISFVK